MAPQRKVLVVEDNLVNREILTEILADQYAVLQAENGLEAMDILKQNKDSISLIMLDKMMTVTDGYALLDKIKEDEDLSPIPVIVTTQSDSEGDEISALTHGAIDFVPKPYRPKVILQRVANLIKLRETAAVINQLRYDRLTGLYSKEYFYQKVREQLLEDTENEYCIVCFNIENFKLYNDTFGVSAGDRLLKGIADITREVVRSPGFCSRFNADRIFCLQIKEQELIDRKNFGRAVGQEIPPFMRDVTMSWGIYEITDRSIPVEQMCDRARIAVDSIKGQYNRCFAVYDDVLRNKLLRENAITDVMESALAENRFTVHLQPKYSLTDECLVGAEALVRWNHPEWGFMSPGEFIPLFEKNGFVHRLDQYIWEQVCALLHGWKEKGYPLLPVSVNVSRTDVYQICLEDVLPELTEKYGIDPSYLHLEVTESAFAKDAEKIIETMDRLRKKGFIVEMDDFGSGYSSLNMLSQMKLDILKLDMGFIRNEVNKPIANSLLEDIINMAHKIGLRVVAEGVETREQARHLRDVGCDYVQGYFFAKPMPVEEYEELLNTQRSRLPAPAPRAKQKKFGMQKLLMIDEDERYREKVRLMLEDEYIVAEASDADSALSYIKDSEPEGISAVILSMTLPEDGAAAVLRTLRRDPALWRIPVLATVPNGERADELMPAMDTDDFLCKCHPVFDLRRRIRRLVYTSEFYKRESVLLDETNRDYMTGLLNRRGYTAAVKSAHVEDFPLALCLFDLDDLKKVNDSMGHDAGDRMIRSFSELLRSQTQAGDVLCRYGGDEFLVILKHIDEKTAMKRATDICRMFNDSFEGEQVRSSCSGGVAVCKTTEDLSDELIKRADQALYRAKREGKSGARLWDDVQDFAQ